MTPITPGRAGRPRKSARFAGMTTFEGFRFLIVTVVRRGRRVGRGDGMFHCKT
jgi:hypothetical protein